MKFNRITKIIISGGITSGVIYGIVRSAHVYYVIDSLTSPK